MMSRLASGQGFGSIHYDQDGHNVTILERRRSMMERSGPGRHWNPETDGLPEWLGERCLVSAPAHAPSTAGPVAAVREAGRRRNR